MFSFLYRTQLLQRAPPVPDIQNFVVALARLQQPGVADVAVPGEPLVEGVKGNQHLRAIAFDAGRHRADAYVQQLIGRGLEVPPVDKNNNAFRLMALVCF
jgi:hypothetical protein